MPKKANDKDLCKLLNQCKDLEQQLQAYIGGMVSMVDHSRNITTANLYTPMEEATAPMVFSGIKLGGLAVDMMRVRQQVNVTRCCIESLLE